MWVNLKVWQYKLSKIKPREKREFNRTKQNKIMNRDLVSCQTTLSELKYIIGALWEEDWAGDRIFEEIIAKTFPNIMIIINTLF